VIVISGVAVAKLRAATDDTAIRPFQTNIPKEAVADMRKRIVATRWRNS
jgi:hypothetical protein